MCVCVCACVRACVRAYVYEYVLYVSDIHFPSLALLFCPSCRAIIHRPKSVIVNNKTLYQFMLPVSFL